LASDIEPSAKSARRPNWALRGAVAMIGFAALALLYVLFAASSKPVPSQGYAHLARGEMRALEVLPGAPPMPAQTLTDSDGRETNLAAFRGEVLVVNLWATWCAPCVAEMPTLGALQRQFEGRLRVLPVSVDSASDREKAKRELAELTEHSLPFLHDSSRGILLSAAVAGMPTTIIYDREGRELARLAAGADWSSPEAAALMEAALAER
jgi:thiol-disulfide isomerase/thioredoxin